MAETRRKISRKQLLKSFFVWSFFSHSCYNYERLESVSFGMSMFCCLSDLYDTKEEIGREIAKHMTFFNTEPNLGCIINGSVCAMEEERANTGGADSPVTEDAIIGVKTGLMGPFAGVGDTLIQGIITPLSLSIGMSMAMNGNAAGPWIAHIMNSAILTAIAYSTWMYGYRWGTDAIDRILDGGLMEQILLGAGVLGCVVMGALVAANVNIYTPLSFLLVEATASNPAKYLMLQYDFFDSIMYGIMPLVSTLLIYVCMRKGWSINKIMLVFSVVGFILGAFGILSHVKPVNLNIR